MDTSEHQEKVSQAEKKPAEIQQTENQSFNDKKVSKSLLWSRAYARNKWIIIAIPILTVVLISIAIFAFAASEPWTNKNTWSSWNYGTNTSAAVTHANSINLNAQFNKYTTGYVAGNYIEYRLDVPTDVTTKTITFNTSYFVSSNVQVYLAADSTGNKVWSKTGRASSTSSTVTVTLNGQHTLYYGIRLTSNFSATSLNRNQYITINSYTLSGDKITASDTIAPTVSLTSPLNGATVTGSVNLSSNAADNVGISSVVYRLDGTDIGTSASSTSPYGLSWNSASVTSGNHSLTAVAKDTSGNVATSSVVSIAVSNAVPPPPPPPTTSSYNDTILLDKPVGFWAVNNTTGFEADLSGNNHTGTYKGGLPTLVSMMNGDKAADFNGSSQYLSVPTSAAFSIPTTKKLTWEGWIRPDVLQFPSATDGYTDWMGKCADYSPTCEWEARMYNTTNPEGRCNRLSVYVFNNSAGLGSGADWQPTCGLVQANQWLHVIGEYQTLTTPSACSTTYPGTIDIWVNGVKWSAANHYTTGCMSQYQIIPKASTSPVNIGAMAMEYWFKGAVGKVAIYDYLLTQAQINTHFTAMTGAAPSGTCANTCTTTVPTQHTP